MNHQGVGIFKTLQEQESYVSDGPPLLPITEDETVTVMNKDALAQSTRDRREGKKPKTKPPFLYALTDSELRQLEKDGITEQLNSIVQYLKEQKDKESGKRDPDEDPDEDQFLGTSKEEWMMVGEGILAGIAAKKKTRFDAGNSWGEAQLKLKDRERDITEEMTNTIKDAEVLSLQQEAIAKDRNTSRRLRIHDKFGARKIAAMNSLQNTINRALT